MKNLLADLTSGDEARAEAAASRPAKAGPEAREFLRPLLSSPNADHRWWVIRTLAEMSEPRIDWLAHALEDEAAEVRAAAALALATALPVAVATAPPGKTPEEATGVPLLIAALGDADSLVASLGGKALAAIGSACVPAVLNAFDSANRRGRIEIVRLLGEIRDTLAIGLLMRATDDGSTFVRHWAEAGPEALGLNMVYLRPE